MKAIGSSSSNKHAAQHIVKDILDPNHRAQAPADHVPATKESVLHKDVSVSEMHSQKQAQAEAKLGMQPGQQKQKGVQRLQKFLENRKNKLEKGKDLSSKANPGGKHGFAKPGEKGIHQPPSKGAQISRHPGQSVAGFHARMGAQGRHPKENARYMHTEKLNELRSMPKPNLPKSEHMAKAIDRHNKYDPNIQGVHRQQPMQPTVKDKGQSAMGQNVRAGKRSWGDPESQKHMARKVLQESKKIKPKLPK